MNDFDLDVRRHVYSSFARDGRPPTSAETATALGVDQADVDSSYRRLHDAHALVLHPGTTEVWMANPFSAIETPHVVESGGRSWYGNCAWDGLAIPAALHADGPQLALDAGVVAIIQPGGSKRDDEVAEAVRAADATMVVTGRRHFRH